MYPLPYPRNWVIVVKTDNKPIIGFKFNNEELKNIERK